MKVQIVVFLIHGKKKKEEEKKGYITPVTTSSRSADKENNVTYNLPIERTIYISKNQYTSVKTNIQQ